MEQLKYAKDLIKTDSVHVDIGFNSFIYGHSEPRNPNFQDKTDWFSQLQGYQYAEKMAKKDGIGFTYPFKCGSSSDCLPFKFGGFFVCNSCGNKSVDKEWWKIKVEKDGNAYCCHGLDFVNLQESNNFAFGDTFEDAIRNYGELMIKKSKP